MQSRLREVVRWALRNARAEMACDFPRITESPSLCKRLPGSWQHRHLARLGAAGFFSMTATDSATEHLKVPVLEHYAQEWQQSCQTYIYRKS